MTNYDMTMDMLAASTFHPDSVEQARKYLRDLKASHDRLYDILAMKDCGKQACPVCASHRDASLKAAKALT